MRYWTLGRQQLEQGRRRNQIVSRDSFIFKEEDENVILTVKTLVPTKWMLIDRETGQIYQGNPEGYWDKLKITERGNR